MAERLMNKCAFYNIAREERAKWKGLIDEEKINKGYYDLGCYECDGYRCKEDCEMSTYRGGRR